MINVLFAINNNQLDDFLNNWRYDDEGQRLNTSFQLDTYQNTLAPVGVQGKWKVNAADNKTLVSIYVQDIVVPDWTGPSDPNPRNILKYAKVLMDTFQGSLVILSAFQVNGLQHGLYTKTLDDITTIEGTVTYKTRARDNPLAYMPDVVTYDPDGIETSRAEATELTDVSLVAGYASRAW